MSQEWLLVIDLQPAFSHPDSEWFTPTLEPVSRTIAGLVPLFGERVLFTRFVPPEQPWGSWRHYYERWSFAPHPDAGWLWELDDPWKGRPSVSSHAFSKWSAARPLLGEEPRVSICGVSTDCCVLATALAAVDDGAHVRVVADACAARTEDIQSRSLALMASRAPQLTIVSAAQERDRLARERGRQE